MKFLNLNNVSRIGVFPKKENWHYTFIEGKKTFWGWRKPQWFDGYWHYLTAENVLKANKDCYIENGTLYYKPFIEYQLSSRNYVTEVFEHGDEMDNRFNQIKSLMGPEWIKLRT